ncbi:MAG: hypothetical protein U1G07_13655 [Verrucomicrobiota bacterium]
MAFVLAELTLSAAAPWSLDRRLRINEKDSLFFFSFGAIFQAADDEGIPGENVTLGFGHAFKRSAEG